MKRIILTFGLVLSALALFSQIPRIRLNQVQKDTVWGSVLISSPVDSNLTYSRDFYIGPDTSLNFYGTVLVAGGGGGGGSFVTTTILSDSLANYILKAAGFGGDVSGTYDNITVIDDSHNHTIGNVDGLQTALDGKLTSVNAGVGLTGSGTTGSPLLVDTSGTIVSKNFYFANLPAGGGGTVTSVDISAGTGISVSGSPITTSGTITVTNSAPDQTVSLTGAGINSVTGTYPNFTITGTEVDGSTTNELQTISTSGAAGNISLSNGGGTLNLNVNDADASATNEGSLSVGAGGENSSDIVSNTSGSTNVTIAGGSNVTVTESGSTITIASTGGGGSSFNNLTETADTVFVAKYLNVDTSTLYVDAINNRVGIGTSAPASIFQVDGTSGSPSSANSLLNVRNKDTNIGFQMGADSTYGWIRAVDVNVAVNNIHLALQPTGINNYVAIGTNNPTSKLYIKSSGTSSATSALNVADFDNNSLLYVGDDGKVGIGTTAPQYKLDVNGDFNLNNGAIYYDTATSRLQIGQIMHLKNLASDGFSGFNVRDSDDTLRASFVYGNKDAATFTNTLGFSTRQASTEMVFLQGGQLAGNERLRFKSDSTIVFSQGVNPRMTIAQGGKVGIGTTAPGSQLHTKSATSNDALLVEDDSGACEAQPTTTGLTWSCSSDQRLKTDIQIPAAVLNYVKNIPLKDYTVIKTAERVMGPIAQELLETYPELVSTGEDGYYRVSSLGSWTLVKAIQEQQAIIESQKAEIDQLKNQYNDLLQRIIQLENK